MNTKFCNHLRSRRETWLINGMALAVSCVLLGGCNSGKDESGASLKGKLVIKGSNTLGEELVPQLVAEYKKDHPGVTVELESKGTGSGFSALLAGDCDIAGASRVANDTELKQVNTKNLELNTYMVGSYTFAVVVNAANPVGSLTKEQVRDIFTGAVKNWNEVGGPDAAINLDIRDPISGTYLGFRELAMEDKPYAESAKKFTNYLDIVKAVAADPNAIGYSSISLAKTDGVKAMSLGQVPASPLAVREGRYAYMRALRLYTNKSKESPVAHDFIQFVQSKRGQDIVSQLGFVPRP
jgi:phosphate transport system substrate-binding protein